MPSDLGKGGEGTEKRKVHPARSRGRQGRRKKWGKGKGQRWGRQNVPLTPDDEENKKDATVKRLGGVSGTKKTGGKKLGVCPLLKRNVPARSRTVGRARVQGVRGRKSLGKNNRKQPKSVH